MKSIIKTSIFDLFKIGPGPSSSHTIGPMKAGFHFVKQLEQLPNPDLTKADKIIATLYGSLSSTGKGHGTDRSVMAGLLGNEPATCDPVFLSNLLQDEKVSYSANIKGTMIPIDPIVFGEHEHNFPYQNTMIIQLYQKVKLF